MKTSQIKKWAEDLRKHVFWRGHTDSQQVHEKVFSITNQNAKQNHNKI